ncbi:Ferric hydroxamate uptake [Sphingomonas paucimobilis]|nr:Ferric hydroxamate uptake [Sphingomonas paucimobilis]
MFAGVAPNQRGNVATRYDQLFLRGFQPGIFMDGMRLLGGVYASPQIDFHLVESVDVVKGPAGVTYGSGTPGGLVNLTSKLPYVGAGGRIELATGQFRAAALGDRREPAARCRGSLAVPDHRRRRGIGWLHPANRQSPLLCAPHAALRPR